MGDSSRPVYLLTWRAGGAVGEATAAGVGKMTPQEGEAIQAKGQAVYEAGQYRAVIRRPLQTKDADDFVFRPGEFFPVALWAWDGSEGDEGPKAGVSTWYYARLEPPPSRRQFVMPPVLALVAGAAGVGVTRWAQRRAAA
jgi:DMSO reductase family type II enzyme heme b subunit